MTGRSGRQQTTGRSRWRRTTGRPGSRQSTRRQSTRRAVTTVLACWLLVAACGGGSDTTDPDDKKKSAESGTIVVASGLDVTGTTSGIRQQLINQWNNQNPPPPLRASLVELPGEADQQRSQLLGAMQSGSAAYDVVNLDITWVPEFAEAGLISPLDGSELGKEVADPQGDFVPQVAATAIWKERPYAVPFNSDVGLLYYRPDFLEAAGIDPANYPKESWKWADLSAAINSVQAVADDVDDPPGGWSLTDYESGWTTQLDEYEGLVVNTIESYESTLTSDDATHLSNAEGDYTGNQAVIEDLLGAIAQRADEPTALSAALTSTEKESLDDFAAGRTAFLRHWPYAYSALLKSIPGAKLKVAQLPGAAVLGGQNLAVSAASPRAEAARELVSFLTNPASERCLLDAGFAATRVSAYADNDVNCHPGVAEAWRTSGSSGEDPDPVPTDDAGRPAYAGILLASLRDAAQRPSTPYYGAVSQVLRTAVHDWLIPGPAARPRVREPAKALDQALTEAFDGR